MFKDDFINERIEKARKAAEAEWDKMMQTRPTSEEGIKFAQWVRQEVDDYSRSAGEKLKKRFRYSSLYDTRGIYNVTYSFILHLVRRNCEVGSHMKTIAPKDIEKAKGLVRCVLDFASADAWLESSAESKEAIGNEG